VLIVNSFY